MIFKKSGPDSAILPVLADIQRRMQNTSIHMPKLSKPTHISRLRRRFIRLGLRNLRATGIIPVKIFIHFKVSSLIAFVLSLLAL